MRIQSSPAQPQSCSYDARRKNLSRILTVLAAASTLLHRLARSGRARSPSAAAPHAGKSRGGSYSAAAAATMDACGRQRSGAPMRRACRWDLRGSHRTKSPRGIAARAFRLRTAAACSASRRPPTPLVHCRAAVCVVRHDDRVTFEGSVVGADTLRRDSGALPTALSFPPARTSPAVPHRLLTGR